MSDPKLASPILFYDGLCGYCNGIVRFLLKIDRKGKIHFSTLQGPLGAELLARRPDLKQVDSAILYERLAGGAVRISIKSGVVVHLGQYLPTPWGALAPILKLVPRTVRDMSYDFIARNRYRFFGRYRACPIPPQEFRNRFV